MYANPEFIVLGSSSAVPTKNRHPSAHILKIANEKILIDCGEGTQVQLIKYGVRESRINYILISHLHGDHYLGLVGLISTMNLRGRKNTLYIVCPPALKPIINIQLKYGTVDLGFKIEYIFTQDLAYEVVLETETFILSTFPLVHRAACTAFVIKEKITERPLNIEACNKHHIPVAFYQSIKSGKDYQYNGISIANSELTFEPKAPKTVSYCTDTLYLETIVNYIENTNLLYHEATFLHEAIEKAERTLHSTALQAGLIAKEANASKLLIGHFSSRYESLEPLLEEAKTVFPNTFLAEEGITVVVE